MYAYSVVVPSKQSTLKKQSQLPKDQIQMAHQHSLGRDDAGKMDNGSTHLEECLRDMCPDIPRVLHCHNMAFFLRISLNTWWCAQYHTGHTDGFSSLHTY